MGTPVNITTVGMTNVGMMSGTNAQIFLTVSMMRCSIWSMFICKEFKNGSLTEGASPGNDAARQTNHSFLTHAYGRVRKFERHLQAKQGAFPQHLQVWQGRSSIS